MAGRKRTKYKKEIVEDIIKEIENDGSLDALYESNKERYPERTVVFKWCKKYPEFNEKYWEARRIQASAIVEKYNKKLAEPPTDSGDKVLNSHNMKIWDRELRALEFKIIRLAKIFDSKTFGETQKVQHEGIPENTGPQILIMNYSSPDAQPQAALEDNVIDVKPESNT